MGHSLDIEFSVNLAFNKNRSRTKTERSCRKFAAFVFGTRVCFAAYAVV